MPFFWWSHGHIIHLVRWIDGWGGELLISGIYCGKGPSFYLSLMAVLLIPIAYGVMVSFLLLSASYVCPLSRPVTRGPSIFGIVLY